MVLEPRFVDALLKALRDEHLSNEDKTQITKFLQKNIDGKLTKDDYISFAKTFFQLSALFKQLLE
jgi:hypothetical protein